MKLRITLLAIVLAMPLLARSENRPAQLRVMSYNVRNGIGMDNIRNYNRAAEVINRTAPDIVALQELDSVTGRSGGDYVLGELARLTSLHPTYSAAIAYDGGGYGIGILSREKPLDVKRIALPGSEEARTLIVAEFGKYIFMATHLSLTESDRLRSLKIIDSITRQCRKPVIVAGDFNLKPDSPEFKEMSNNFNTLSARKGSYPADKPTDCIDYIIGGKQGDFYTRAQRSEVVDAPIESDHRPIVADLEYGAIMRTKPYLQNPTGGGITVCWQTNTPSNSWVEYGVDSLNLTKARTIKDGQIVANNKLNKIRLSDLTPGARYYYRVHSREIIHFGAYGKIFGGETVSPIYSFCIVPDDAREFTAVVFNDLHQRGATLDTLLGVIRNKNIAYDYVFFNGDCIDDPSTEAEAVATLSYFSERVDASNKPVLYIRGNHEIRGAFSIHFSTLFDYAGGETYGSFNIGDTRFMVLDCGEDKPDEHWAYSGLNDFTGFRLKQREFIAKELSSSEFKSAKKRVLIHHIPLYGQPEEYHNLASDVWCDLLEKAPFDIAINGHTHSFASYKKGEVGNNFPVVVGGGFDLDNATVTVIKRSGTKLTVTVFDTKGKELFTEIL